MTRSARTLRFAQGRSQGCRPHTVPLCRRADTVLPMRPHKPNDAHSQRNTNDKVELVKVFSDRPPVLAELHADVGKAKAPWPGTEKGVNVEFHSRHAGYTGRKRNKGANHGQ